MMIKAVVIMLLLTGIASASVWVGDNEIGLAQYQNSGDVAGTYIVRDSSSDINNIYTEIENQDMLWQQFRRNPEGLQINSITKHIKRLRRIS